MIRVIVLGSAASMPSKRFVPSCFAVKYGAVYLFDACEGVQRQMMRYGASYAKLRAVFLSHLHADHFLGVLGLIQTMNMAGRKEELLVFGPKGTKRLFETILGEKHLAPAFKVTAKDVAGEGVVLEEKLFAVKAFAVEHGAPALGYVLEEFPHVNFDERKARSLGIKGCLFSEITERKRIIVGGKTVKLSDVTFEKPGKKIVYSGDTLACPAVAKQAKNADLLIHDSCFAEAELELAKEKMHSTAKQAAETAKKAGAKKLLLTHFSNRYEDDRTPLLQEAQKIFPNSVFAEEGMELLI